MAIALFQTATSTGNATGAAVFNAQYAQQLLATFADQRLATYRYFAVPTPNALAAAQALDTRFRDRRRPAPARGMPQTKRDWRPP